MEIEVHHSREGLKPQLFTADFYQCVQACVQCTPQVEVAQLRIKGVTALSGLLHAVHFSTRT